MLYTKKTHRMQPEQQPGIFYSIDTSPMSWEVITQHQQAFITSEEAKPTIIAVHCFMSGSATQWPVQTIRIFQVPSTQNISRNYKTRWIIPITLQYVKHLLENYFNIGGQGVFLHLNLCKGYFEPVRTVVSTPAFLCSTLLQWPKSASVPPCITKGIGKTWKQKTSHIFP